MKKQQFLIVDFRSTVKLSSSRKREIDHWILIASEVLEELFKKKIIEANDVKVIELSLLLCGESKIRKLNHEFRHKDKVTDVLSFPNHETLRSGIVEDVHLFLGDLAICHQKVTRQAKEFKIGYKDEFIHLLFHGIIHLLGYDHELSRAEEKLMQKWEELALEEFSKIKKSSAKKKPLARRGF